jgi:5-methylthioadenosine/S-adenosylhomocysteine deaminase
VPINIHLHETEFEVNASMDRFNKRPLERLANLGLATPRLQAVHMTHLMQAEIDFCATRGIHMIHCPESNLKLSSGFAPVSRLIDAGVNVAIGTDGAASNNDLDMFGEMRSAALLAKGVSGSPTSVPAHCALEMATINGARAMGLDEVIGSIEVGKFADLVAVDLSEPRTQPLYDAVAQLVYSAASSQVSDVWIAGRRVLRDGELTTHDSQQILSNAKTWHETLNTSRIS